MVTWRASAHTVYVRQVTRKEVSRFQSRGNLDGAIAGTNVGYTFAEYLDYRAKVLDNNETPLRFELWQLREIGARQSRDYIMRINSGSDLPIPNISAENPKPRYRKVKLEGLPVYAGDRTNNADGRRHKRIPNRITLSAATYLLSLPKRSGAPLIVDNEGRVDVKRTLAFLTFYRLFLATYPGIAPGRKP